MTSGEVRLAEERLRQAEFWKSNGAAFGDWTQWGSLRRNEDYMKAMIDLILAKAGNRALSMQEEAQIKDLMGQIAQNRENHIRQTVAQPGTSEYYVMREREYHLKKMIEFEQQVNSMRQGNQDLGIA